eukprot:scpid27658/ scgid32254/ DCC-interacting protein 13-alpha; Adapter protein containing PH domain, PTB domain and leucine zipper motif 1
MSTGHGSKRIHLNDALEDTPKTRALISEFEQGTLALHDFTVTLLTNCRIVADLQAQMTKATGNLANHLSEGKNLVFAQKNPFLGTALDQLGESMQQLQSWQDMLHIQIQEAVMQPLNTFFQEELINVEKTKETYSGAVQDHENAMSRYSRVSKKKETEKNRFEANADLYTARKKYHQVAMQYYSTLNLLQSKQSYSVLDPLINLMHAQLSYFKMGHEILTEEVAKFLTTLSVQAQKDRSEHNIENRKLSSLREKIEQEYSSRYNPDPDPSDPFSDVQPADRSLKEKAGYLYTKNVKPGPSRGQWERAYFHTDNGMLMCQLPDTKTAEPTMLLDPSARAGTLDCDDRRYCFQVVSSHTKEPILLQAENDVTREEWVSTILNIVAELTHKAETPASGDVGLMSSTLSAKDVKEERQRVATWVEDVLKVEGERNTPQVQRSAVPTQTPPAHQVQPAQDATQGAMAAAAVAGGGAAGGGAMGATAMPGTQQLQQQQQQQQTSMMPAAASTAMGAAAAGAQPSFTTGQPSAAADDDATAIYATVNKSAHKAGQASTERPDSVSPVSSDSSTTTTSTTSTSSSDAEAALAGLTIAQHPSMTDARENPFNRLSPGASFPPGQVTSGVPGSGGWQPSALPDHFQGDFSHPEPAVVVETVESPADNNDLEPSPLVTEMAMSLTSLSALHSGLVAPSTTPAVAGLLDTAAADAAMAVAMAAAATLHEADNEDDDGAGLERSPSQSSLLSDLSDS